jgi:hypothetical protein
MYRIYCVDKGQAGMQADELYVENDLVNGRRDAHRVGSFYVFN